jgi:hypothetical protein
MPRSRFGLAVRQWAEQVEDRQEEVTRIAIFKVFARIIERSPVGNPDLWKVNSDAAAYNKAVIQHNDTLRQDPDNISKNGRLKPGRKVHDSMDIKKPDGYTGGRFRGNWQIGLDTLPTEETGRVDKTGSRTLSAGMSVLEQFKVGQVQTIYIANNVPYAIPLEYGHSKQAPNGMVRLSVMEFTDAMEEALREAKKVTT